MRPPVSDLSSAVRPLWARTTLRVAPDLYWMVSLPPSSLTDAAQLVATQGGAFGSLIAEPDEVSLTVSEKAWKASPLRRAALADAGPFRAITFNLDVDLAVSGYFSPAASRLAEAGISIVPQCAFLKDHVLVRTADLAAAISCLEQLISECRSANP